MAKWLNRRRRFNHFEPVSNRWGRGRLGFVGVALVFLVFLGRRRGRPVGHRRRGLPRLLLPRRGRGALHHRRRRCVIREQIAGLGVVVVRREREVRELHHRGLAEIQRAELLTDFYHTNLGRHSVPVMRALAFKHLCRHKTIFIGGLELIGHP